MLFTATIIAARQSVAIGGGPDTAKTVFEDYTAQVTKLGELYSNLAKEVFKPFEGFSTKASPAK